MVFMKKGVTFITPPIIRDCITQMVFHFHPDRI